MHYWSKPCPRHSEVKWFFVSDVFAIVKLFHCIVCKYSSHVKPIKSFVEIFVVTLSYIGRGGPVNRKSPSTVLTTYTNTDHRIFMCNSWTLMKSIPHQRWLADQSRLRKIQPGGLSIHVNVGPSEKKKKKKKKNNNNKKTKKKTKKKKKQQKKTKKKTTKKQQQQTNKQVLNQSFIFAEQRLGCKKFWGNQFRL